MTHRFLFDPPTNGAGDYHAHIFEAGTCAVANPRYVPDYSATLPDYVALLQLHGLKWGTLIQPSFLGTDNSLLLAALAQRPETLRAVVVVDERDPKLTCQSPAEWSELGVRGVRLNLLGKDAPDLTTWAWKEFISEIGRLGWHLEFQVKADQLRRQEAVIAELPCKVVIDHLGLPESPDLESHPLAGLSEYDHVWVKASGVYRSARGCAEALADGLISRGFDRIVFGSDWPHTRFETQAENAWQWAHRPEMQPTA